MLFVRPDFYDEFECLAGACRHSCCVGWEIDVDAESLARYRRVPGALGRRLRENISADGQAHFILTEDGRCPFLRPDGLCTLILELGEESLTDICASHPRFYNAFPGRLEAGLGLCCEEAARLLTEGTGHLRLFAEELEGEDAAPTPLLLLRGRIFSLLSRDALPLSRRMEEAMALLGRPLPAFRPRESARFFLTLEHLDPAWPPLLQCLAQQPETAPLPEGLRHARIAEYLVYRHFAAGPEDGAAARLAFCFHALRLIAALEPLNPDALRLFSSEIEYSDENIGRICVWLEENN